jgi:tetratricopeptide (TPR) repeat protein
MRYTVRKPPMKNLCLILLLLPCLASGQQVISAANEPVALYQEINNALATDQPKLALEHFRKIVTLYEEQGRFSELPQTYFGMALGLALNGNYKESIRYHKKAIRAHKKFRKDEPLEIIINLGLTYTLAGKDRKARKILGPLNFSS